MHSIFNTIAEAKLWIGTAIPPNQEALITINGQFQRWRFELGSTAVDTSEQLVFAPTSNPASGKWTRADPVIDLKLPWAYNTADGTVLLTVPTGLRLRVISFACEVVGALTGIDTGSIGVDSSKSLDPGGIGSILATGGAGFRGVAGADIVEPRYGSLLAGDTIRENIITPGYTGGTGFWHIMCALMQT